MDVNLKLRLKFNGKTKIRFTEGVNALKHYYACNRYPKQVYRVLIENLIQKEALKNDFVDHLSFKVILKCKEWFHIFCSLT